MSIRRDEGRTPWLALFLIVVVALAAAWFLGPIIHGYRLPSGLVPTAAPTAYFTAPIDSAPRSAVLGYARSLNYDSTQGVGDFRRVMVGSCPRCVYGPHVFLRPERGAAALDTARLAEGRMLARLINFDSTGYAKFNLAARDTVYWWVDRRGPGGTWRSMYVSSDPGRRLQQDTLIVTSYHSYRWERTWARFLWRDADEALWVACDMTGCCKSSGADIY